MSYMSLEIPTFWKMTAFLFTPPTYLLGFPGPCARPQAIGWNGHQSQGNQGLKERGFDGRCPLLFVNFGDKLRWMLPIYGDTFMAKHSTSICQWSWFSIDSLPTSQILALTLESWQNMPWKVQLVSKNSTTTTTATRYIRWMMHPKKRPLRYFPPPTPHLKKSAASFLDALPKRTHGHCEGLFRIRNWSSVASTVSWHCAILQFYLREPCPMFIHSSHFHADRKRNTVNTYIIIYNISQDVLPFGSSKELPQVPSDLEGHESPAGLQ